MLKKIKMTEDRLEKQRLRRRESGNAVTKKYEKTKKGFLMRMYRNMKSRVTGVQKQKYHLYENKSLLSKDEFMSWANENSDFHKLFAAYESSGYDRKFAPSVDRINSSLGYFISNMEFVTHSENSRRGACSPLKRKLTEQDVIKIRSMYSSGSRYSELSKMFNVTIQNIMLIVTMRSWKNVNCSTASV